MTDQLPASLEERIQFYIWSKYQKEVDRLNKELIEAVTMSNPSAVGLIFIAIPATRFRLDQPPGDVVGYVASRIPSALEPPDSPSPLRPAK